MENKELAPRLPVSIEDEMRTSYLDYAMSVIIGRALPDARDGLKPVHRRVLFAMSELKNTWNQPYKKSARIVGDVIGKYHPHGDSAVYDTIVRMAQDFSLRYLLVDGQGNFGSIDGDRAAAMRYTEIRMSKLANELLADLDKETVDFTPNYDGSIFEPAVLPSKVPNLLINGSAGIAVGMATNIPPHNLGECIDATIALIRNPGIGVESLMEHVRGPDFPTAGFVMGRDGIESAYRTGRGSVTMRGRVDIESGDATGKRDKIIITELPYQVNKARLMERIAGLVREKKIEGIHHLQDESDRTGMRISIELKRDAMAQVVVNMLYKMTPLQSTFGIINLAIVDGRPRELSLKEMLSHFVDHRRDVVTRRCLYELRQAEAREHILEGYKIALDHIDEIIALIRGSANGQEAREKLIARFALSEKQAQAILDMRLQRLTGMERDKILAELEEVRAEIKRLRDILANDDQLMQVIVEELEDIRERFADDRRTELLEHRLDISLEDLIAREDMAVTITHDSYIKRMPVALYRAQHRGGKGKRGARPKEEDVIVDIFVANTHTQMLIFTDRGRVFKLKVYELPEGGPQSRGRPIVNLLPVEKNEKVRAVLPVPEWDENKAIIFATRNGLVKKTPLMAYTNVLSRGIIAISLVEGDDLVSVALVEPEQHVLLASKRGQSIRFDEADARSMGRGTRGVYGMRLAQGDQVIGMQIIDPGSTILSITTNGYGKRTLTGEYRVQSRGGKGIITIKTGGRNGDVIAIRQVHEGEDLLLVTNQGQLIRTPIESISVVGRNTLGVRIINLDKKSQVVAVEVIPQQEEEPQLYDENGEPIEPAELTEEGGAGEGGEATASADAGDQESSSQPEATVESTPAEGEDVDSDAEESAGDDASDGDSED